MAPFKVLYGHRCHTPLNWIEPREKVIFGPDLVEEAEATVRRIQDNLKAMKSCQETYANKRRRPLEFEVGNHVYLRVSSMKGVNRFGMKGKLAPRYIGAFPIFEKCGTVAYKLLAVIKYIYLPSIYLHFIQDIEDRCLLLTSSTSFVDLPFQEHRMKEKHHMDQNPYISSLCPKPGVVTNNMT
jgi:hypothetical protein